MKKLIGNGINKLGSTFERMPQMVGAALTDEFNNLMGILNSNNDLREKVYAGVTFVDPQAWAENHPEVIKPVTVTVLGAVGTACPVTIPIATLVGVLPEKICVDLMDWGNRPCPPYLLRMLLKKKHTVSKDESAAEYELISENTDMELAVAS